MRTKIIGRDQCPHINKKSGNRDCQKPGRLNPKPMKSWNNKFDKGKKREYMQFIHNDGTRHNIASFEQHQLNEMNGNPFEELFKGANILENVFRYSSNTFHKIAESSRRWRLNESEWIYLYQESKNGNFKPMIRQYQKYEQQRRRKIYDDSQTASEEKYRDCGTIQTQVNRVDEIARDLLNSALLGLSREDLKLKLNKLTEEQFIKVYERYDELVNSFEKWLYDRKKLIEQVAREKGITLRHMR